MVAFVQTLNLFAKWAPLSLLFPAEPDAKKNTVGSFLGGGGSTQQNLFVLLKDSKPAVDVRG